MLRDFTATSDQYVDDVLTGKIPACRQIKLACERYRRDRSDAAWVYDPDKTHHACAFIELLPHSKGALARQRLTLEPWQVFIIANIFGFIGHDGLRKYREAFLLIPRKNGKSEIAARIALYMAFMDGEVGAEVWIGANSMDQANAVFKPVKAMASVPMFIQATGIEVMAQSVSQAATGNFVRPMIGKPRDGTNPHCAILDEAHEADEAVAYDAMKTGMGARTQPLLLSITTAGVNLAGPCFLQQRYAEAVLEGHADNPHLFCAIWTLDPQDKWQDFDCWKKANPNYGVSVTEDFLKAAHSEALQRPEKAAMAQTKHLNRWVSSRSAWLNMADWSNAAADLNIEDFVGCTATLGLDLATKTDVAAVIARVMTPEGKIAVFPFLYLPDAALTRSKNAESYRQWHELGHLITTDGNATDFATIEDKVRDLCSLLSVEAIGFDQWQAEQMMQNLMADGLPVIKCAANTKTFAPAMLEFEAHLADGQLTHPNNHAFNWMAANVVAKADARGNLYPRKPDGQDHLKIDGIVAALMAEAVAIKPSELTADPIIAVW